MRIILTGTSSGIGRHLAETLWREGHQVWGWARSDQTAWQSGLDPTAARLRTTRVDVSDWAAVAAAAREVGDTWSRLDALVCAAGTQGEIGPAMTSDPLRWEATVRANLSGTFFCVRALFAALAGGRTAGRAKVVVFSGGGASRARPRFSAYGAAKTAIVRLVETLADEWQGLPVDINAVAPGAIRTAMTAEVLRAGPERTGANEHAAAQRVSAQGGAALEKATRLVQFLLSSAADHLSGRLLSAPWDPWAELAGKGGSLTGGDLYTLRRVTGKERSS